MLKNEVEIFERTKGEFIEKYGEEELFRLSQSKGTKRTLQALIEGLIRARQGEVAKATGNDKQRLTRAYKAISGIAPRSFANERNDLGYLSHMAEMKAIELRAISTGKRYKLSSNVILAKLALKNVENQLGLDEALKYEKRISGKFASFWKTWNELEQDKLAHFEALQTTALTLLELTLKELGIPFYAYE